MPIPNFDANGLLPVGRHTATEAEIEAALVSAFPASQRRPFIFERWRLIRHNLKTLLQIHEQWIDGSFAESKPEPDDVDLVTVFDGEAFDTMSPEQQFLPLSLMNGHWTEQFWKCDSFGVAMYSPGHPMWGPCQGAVHFWDNWWGHLREDDPRGHLPKGYVVVE